MKKRMVEIVRTSPEKQMIERELKRKLTEEGLLKPSIRGSIGQTYYNALDECVSEGLLGETAEIDYSMEDKKGRKRRRATKVFHYIESGEDRIREIFADLDYDVEKKEFGKKVEELPPEAISTLLNKLEGVLNNYSAVPAVIDFIVSAIGEEHLATKKKTLVACLSQAVKKAVEEGNKALLARVDENIEWLNGAINTGAIDKINGVRILLMLKKTGGLDLLLSLLENARFDQYDTTDYANLVFKSVKIFPQEKERIKRDLYKVLREDEGKDTSRKSAAEYILSRI
jgi:hypothetical protein